MQSNKLGNKVVVQKEMKLPVNANYFVHCASTPKTNFENLRVLYLHDGDTNIPLTVLYLTD